MKDAQSIDVLCLRNCGIAIAVRVYADRDDPVSDRDARVSKCAAMKRTGVSPLKVGLRFLAIVLWLPSLPFPVPRPVRSYV